MFDMQCILMVHDAPRFGGRFIGDFVVCGSASDMTAGEVEHQRPTGLEQFLHILEMFFFFLVVGGWFTKRHTGFKSHMFLLGIYH